MRNLPLDQTHEWFCPLRHSRRIVHSDEIECPAPSFHYWSAISARAFLSQWQCTYKCFEQCGCVNRPQSNTAIARTRKNVLGFTLSSLRNVSSSDQLQNWMITYFGVDALIDSFICRSVGKSHTFNDMLMATQRAFRFTGWCLPHNDRLVAAATRKKRTGWISLDSPYPIWMSRERLDTIPGVHLPEFYSLVSWAWGQLISWR